MDDFFSVMTKTNFAMDKFEEQRSLMDNIHNDNSIQFDLISSLISNGFETVVASNRNVLAQNDNLNLEMTEAINHISINLQDGFRNLQIPANVITESLLTRVEGQYQVYLKRKIIQWHRE
jgi:hypothetical protein